MQSAVLAMMPSTLFFAPAIRAPHPAVRRVRGHVFQQLVVVATLMMMSGAIQAQQWRPIPGEPSSTPRRDQAGAPVPPDLDDDMPERQRTEIREIRRERVHVRWLRSISAASVSAPKDLPPPSRAVGMSREERHRLRSDIREAGYSAYAPSARRDERDIP